MPKLDTTSDLYRSGYKAGYMAGQRTCDDQWEEAYRKGFDAGAMTNESTELSTNVHTVELINALNKLAETHTKMLALFENVVRSQHWA